MSLRGTQALSKHPLAELRPQSVQGYEVDAAAQPMFEVPLKPRQGKEPHGMIEVDEQVDIAVISRFVPCRGPEKQQGAHAVFVEFRAVRAKDAQNNVTLARHG